MNTVVNALRLVFLILTGLAFLLGQGWLAAGPLLHGSLLGKKSNIPLLQEIAFTGLCGLIMNYGVILAFQSLKAGLAAGGILAAAGLGCFLLYLFRYRIKQRSQPLPGHLPGQRPRLAPALQSAGAGLVCLIFLVPIVVKPLEDWDERSIWFFHAKMIDAAGTLGLSAGWQHPSILFSHPDYPLLVPALAAQVTCTMGLWNEYLPKIALFFLLIPAVAFLFTFSRWSFSFAFLLCVILLRFTSLVWNGYMDAYLAIYFAIAMLLLGRYIQSAQPVDLISCAGCLIVLSYIKNEGVLALLAGFCAMILALFLKREFNFPKNKLFGNWSYFLAGILGLLPLLLWSVYKQQWILTSDLQIGTASLARIDRRLADGSYQLIFQFLFKEVKIPLLIFGLAVIAWLAWKRPPAQESLPALLAAGIYCLGIITIYLLTPYDLAWHLDTSIGRTLFSCTACIFISSYYVLNAVETGQVFSVSMLNDG